MKKTEIFSEGIEKLLKWKFAQKRMTGWFEYQELKMNIRVNYTDPDAPENQPEILCECVRQMKLSIPEGSVIAGTQDDAFSPSYALINPAFQIETFAGYCDPVATTLSRTLNLRANGSKKFVLITVQAVTLKRSVRFMRQPVN